MRDLFTIRRLLSALLLVLFAFSVTPKKLLHDLVAKHKDTPGKFSGDSRIHLQKTTFSCHTDDLVVESPFVTAGNIPTIQAPPVYRPLYAEWVVSWFTSAHLHSSLRGPPVCA